MINLSFGNFTLGQEVKITYIPMPYLGTGIVEPVVITGKMAEPRVFKGVTYVIIKDNAGKIVLERNAMEIQSIEKVGGTAPQEAPQVARSYSRA